MAEKYSHCIAQWNAIFSEASSRIPSVPSSGNEALDAGIIWVCEGTDSVLDFGCGHGTMLFLCALNGTQHHTGIDLSEAAIEKAQERARHMPVGNYSFLKGSIEQLQSLDASCVDAVILSNILDNLYPEDAEAVLEEAKRLLKKNGKLLVKLNPWLTPEQIAQWEIDIIKDDLLDDGMLLLNHTTQTWEQVFKQHFNILRYTEVIFPEHAQTNRMFFLTKK